MGSDTIRRLVAFAVGLAAVTLSKRFGLDLSDSDKAGITALVVGYLLQSGYKAGQEAKAAGLAAAAKIQTPGDAAAALGKIVPSLLLVVAIATALLPTRARAQDMTIDGGSPDAGGAYSVPVLMLEAGAPAPAAGCFLASGDCVTVAKSKTACEVERAELRKVSTIPAWAIVAVGVVAAGAGAAGAVYLDHLFRK